VRRKMNKYKPKWSPFESTLKALELKSPELIPLGLSLDVLNLVIASSFKITLWKCGNPHCNNYFVVQQGKPLPKFCRKCGCEIDWTPPLLTRKAIICSKCGREYHEGDKYCEDDGSRLEEREVPI
jgi:hypothetical protein